MFPNDYLLDSVILIASRMRDIKLSLPLRSLASTSREMIDVKEKPRRSKRKFHEAVEENGCPIQPKETILDMSVSKLAKAKTRLNLEPSLRKTVMIVNTIRKIEQEIENGKGVIAGEMRCFDRCMANGTCSDTKKSFKVPTFEEPANSAEVLPVRLSLSVEKRNVPSFSENNSETLNNRYHSFNVTLAKSDEAFIDLTQTSDDFKNKFMGKCSSSVITSVPSHSELPDIEEAEINFAEIDISLYDFDGTLWSEGGLQISCGEFENNDKVYKTSNGLSAVIRRCSDDLKLNKTTDNSLTDDLDQIMQVLVGI